MTASLNPRSGAAPSAAAAAPASPSADEALLEGLRQGEAAAVEALYDRYHSVALGLALRVVRNYELAEDVVQEAFLAVWRQAASYRAERGTVRTWLLSIVHHRAVDRLRRRDVPAAALEEPLPDTGQPELWEQAASAIQSEHVRAALRALPAEQRSTVVLAYFDGLSCQQIADRLRLPLGTVKGRMRLALQKLRVLLQSERVELTA